eukprot:6659421-Alexandrium_andersonii.AAC.1
MQPHRRLPNSGVHAKATDGGSRAASAGRAAPGFAGRGGSSVALPGRRRGSVAAGPSPPRPSS